MLPASYTPASTKGLAMSTATLPQAVKVLELLTQKKVSVDRLQRLLEGGFIADLLEANGNLNRDSFRQFLGLGTLYPVPTLIELPGIVLSGSTVPLSQRIKDGGYNWSNSDITAERFPLTLPPGPRNLVLAHFNQDIESESVEAWAKEHGYEVSPIDDLLAVGSHPEHKELQRQYPIVALGSSAVVGGSRHVPYLGGSGSERDLGLDYDGSGWYAGCRFLLRKVQPSVA